MRSEDYPLFGGSTFVESLDCDRLRHQLGRVRSLMLDGVWRTLAEISAVTGDPQASISARIRDLRKDRFGGYRVDRRRRAEAERGIFEYRVQ